MSSDTDCNFNHELKPTELRPAELKPTVTIECPRCEGTGGVTCTKCDGSGIELSPAQWIDIYRDDPGGPLPDLAETCPRCYGMKEIACPTCGAVGKI